MSAARANPTVQAAFLHALFDEAQRVGLDRGELARRSAFDPDQVKDPDQRLPQAVYLRVWQTLHAWIDDPALALKLGAAVDPRHMGIVGSVLLSCRTLREVGQQFSRYARLFDSHYQVSQQEIEGIYTYSYIADCPAQFEPGFVELHLSGAISVCRMLSQADLVPLEVRFRYPEPAHVAHYHALFRAPLRFGQDENAILFHARDLDRLVVHHNQYANTLLVGHAAALLEELERDDSVAGKVRRFILARLPTGKAGIDDCAQSLCMSRRTLHRRLAQEATSFQALQEELRRQMALEYLAAPGTPAAEVALLLGYSEPSAFHRAFRRWSGDTVAAYRRTAGANATGKARIGN